MRRLNLRLLAGLVAAGVLLSGGAWALHRHQVRRTARGLLATAGRAEAAGQLDRACGALSRYLALRPGDTDSLARYALLLDRSAATSQARAQAVRALDEVLRRAPGRPDVRRRLARAELGLGRVAEARANLDLLRRAAPRDGELDFLQGCCDEADGEFVKAAAWYEKAREHDPNRLDAPERLANLARTRLDSPERADRVLDAMVTANPESVPARLDRARYRARYRLPGAEDDLKYARHIAPDAADVILEVARAAQAKRDFDEARRLLNRGRHVHPRDGRMDDALAELERRAGRPAEALSCLRRGLAEKPDQVGLRWSLAQLLARSGATTELGEQIEVLRRSGFGAVPLHYLTACRHVNAAEWSEARSILEGLQPVLAAWPQLEPRAHERLGLCDDQLEDRAGAIKHYLQAIALGENAPHVIQRAARLLFAARRYDEADQLLRRLAATTPLPRDLQHLATGVALRTQDPDRALELARKAVTDRPDDVGERVWLGQVLWAAGRHGMAEESLSQAAQEAPASPDVWLALVQCRARRGRTREAVAALQEAELALPDDQRPLALAQGHELLGHGDEARRSYETALAARPDDISILRKYVNFLIKSGQAPEAESRLRALLAREPQAASDRDWARRMLVLALTLGNDYRRVREALALAEGLGAAPDDCRVRVRVLIAQRTRRARNEAIALLEKLDLRGPLGVDDRFLLAQICDLNGDWPKAQTHWQRVLGTSPRDPLYLATFADALRRHGQGGEARLLADQLERVEPRTLRAVALKARLLHDQGQAAEAEERLLAYANQPGVETPPVAALLEELGRFDAAESLLRKGAESRGRPLSALSYAAFLGRRDRIPVALDWCERVWSEVPLEAVARACVAVLDAGKADDRQVHRVASRLDEASVRHPENTPLLIASATVRERQGRYSEAEALYRRAISRGDGGAVPLNNLSWLVALKGGQGGEALELIDRAIGLAGPEPELLDTRAVALLALGRPDRAIEDLNEALAARPSAPAFFHLAQAHLKAHDSQAATAAFRKANQAGLTPSGLHPLEQSAYRQVLAELAGR